MFLTTRLPIKSRKCFCCESSYRLADHHLQPRESGGLNEERNLVTLCCTCHDAVEGQHEGLSSGDIWLNILKRKASFGQESPRRKRHRLSRENAQPCPPCHHCPYKLVVATDIFDSSLNIAALLILDTSGSRLKPCRKDLLASLPGLYMREGLSACSRTRFSGPTIQELTVVSLTL